MSYNHWDASDYEDYGRQNIQAYWEQTVAYYAPFSSTIEFTEEDCVFLKSLGATV